jgi:hypothetical protein
MTWLEEITTQHAELESPKSFWFWSALAAISAVVKDNVWFDKQQYNLYPNIYVMLYADSGVKKGPPISMAKRLVASVDNTTIINGRSSIQGILKKLGTSYTKPGGIVMNKAVGFICSSELSASLVEDKAALDILTDLYDRHYNSGEYESLLKMESFSLKDTTVTLLGGINAAHAENFLSKKDMQGGYVARSFIIYEELSQTINSLMFAMSNPPNYPVLEKYLKDVARLKGPFLMSIDARHHFDDWYKRFKNDIRTNKIHDPTGTLNRFDDSVLKVAMLTSLGTNLNLEITEDIIDSAISKCETLVGNVRKTTMASGRSEWASQKSLLINELIGRDGHAISKQMLNRKFWMHCGMNDWDEICAQMEVAGILRIESVGNTIMYKMVDDQVEEWTNYFLGKQQKL